MEDPTLSTEESNLDPKSSPPRKPEPWTLASFCRNGSPKGATTDLSCHYGPLSGTTDGQAGGPPILTCRGQLSMRTEKEHIHNTFAHPHSLPPWRNPFLVPAVPSAYLPDRASRVVLCPPEEEPQGGSLADAWNSEGYSISNSPGAGKT